MFVFSCKISFQTIISRYSRTHFCVLRIPYPKSFSQISESTNSPSLVVDYLINSCGLSPEKALSASKQIRVRFKTTKNPDSVLRFLETNGFSKTHITKIISNKPQILCAKVDKTLEPKIKQLQDLGLSGLKLTKLIASNPTIFTRSLKRQIIPNLEFIRGFVETDEHVYRAVNSTKWLLSSRLESCMRPNIALLRDYKVPDSGIAYLIITRPANLFRKTELFKEIVENIKRLGFKPEIGSFIVAINTVCSMSKSTWGAKLKLLKSLGWSEEEIFSAFRSMPIFLSTSEKKIKQGMDFFAKMLNWNASMISRYPRLLSYSLEKRVIPRFTVFKILKAKELVREERRLITMLKLNEKVFLKKFVTKYQDEVPDLLKAYKGADVLTI